MPKTTYECDDCDHVDIVIRDIVNYCTQCGSNNIKRFLWFSQEEVNDKIDYWMTILKVTNEKNIKTLEQLKKELLKDLLLQEDHDYLVHDLGFGKVKTRCPVCYTESSIRLNIKKVFVKYGKGD